ncbi:hypothetical protein KO361_02845 [Candidatus Woesearchaeota archaeon]|nr:hypothetical protein [Candidatus Woesearchaeota archaeon]
MNKKLEKKLKLATIISLGITIITTIPLFVSYVKDVPVKYPLFTHLHVWFGLAFLVFALLRIILNKKK